MAYSPNDHFARKAKKENYVARSVYKLQELDEKFRLFRKGDKVLDLGCSPGSWSQYASEQIGEKGRILGIDLTPMRIGVPCAKFIIRDIFKVDFEKETEAAGIALPFDIVISDMAPATTGSKAADKARSAALCEMALQLCLEGALKLGGTFVCKMFDGPDTQPFRSTLKTHFDKVGQLRPRSTRKESAEFFFCAQGLKAHVARQLSTMPADPRAL